MSWMIGIFAAAAALAVGRMVFGGANIASRIDHAAHTGNLDLLVEHIESLPAGEQPTQWDHAIGSLWQAYHRDTAAELVMDAATRSEAPVIQYWIRQFMEVEPEIAAQHFTQGFLDEHFRPEVAMKCGRKGCC